MPIFMFRIKNLIVFTVIIGLTMACSFDGLLTKLEEEQLIIVQPSPLQYHANAVQFDAIVRFPHHLRLKAETRYQLDFSYQTPNGDSLYLGKIVIKGDLAGKSPEIRKRFTFPFEPRYQSGEVLVQTSLIKNKQVVVGHSIKVADGIINTHQLIRPAYQLYLAPHGHVNEVAYENKSFRLYFDRGTAELNYTTLAQKEAQLLEDYVAQNKLHGEIQIVGNHSPESTEATTPFLAKQRADAAANHILTLYQRYGQTTVPQMTTRGIMQDWGLFNRTINQTHYLNPSQKTDILRQIDGGISFHSMASRFKTLDSYAVLSKYIFPKLRQATVIVSVQKPSRTEAEIIVMANQIVDEKLPATALTASEFAFAAYQSTSLYKKRLLYETALTTHNSLILHNNLAYTYLQLYQTATNKLEKEKLVQMAIISLKKALKLEKGNTSVTLNLAAAQLLAKADQQALQSVVMLPKQLTEKEQESVATIKGTVYLNRGDYIAAIKSLSDAGNSPQALYNKAMAYLLYASQNNSLNIYPKAAKAFDEAIKTKPKYALAHYGAAITAARMKKEKQMAQYLRKAIRLDASLRTKAANDLEFIQYKSSEAFKEALAQ